LAAVVVTLAHATKATYFRKIGNPSRKAPPVRQISLGGALR
jgi:hypothetical protein